MRKPNHCECEVTSDKVTQMNTVASAFKSCLEAEQGLVAASSPIVRLLFLATNLPFWLIAVDFGREVLEANSPLQLPGRSLCDSPLGYCLVTLAVAIASTTMHTVQLRLLPGKQSANLLQQLTHCQCSAMLHPETLNKFYGKASQKRLKTMDRSCAAMSFLFFVTCRDTQHCMLWFLLCVPCFLAGAYFKRTEMYSSYLVAHSLWHVSSALAAYHLYHYSH